MVAEESAGDPVSTLRVSQAVSSVERESEGRPAIDLWIVVEVELLG
jgi:hypothetical protein